MTRIFLYIILLFLFVNQTKGQQATIHSDCKKNQLDTFLIGLKKQGVDTILIYSVDGYGLRINLNYIADSLASRPTYILWKKNNHVDLKRFDIYYPYKSVTLREDTVLTFAFKHIDIISKENMWDFKKKLDDSLVFKPNSHFNFCTVTLICGANKFSYIIEDYLTDIRHFESTVTKTYQFKLYKAIRSTVRSTWKKSLKREVY